MGGLSLISGLPSSPLYICPFVEGFVVGTRNACTKTSQSDELETRSLGSLGKSKILPDVPQPKRCGTLILRVRDIATFS
jgi:hypothetical protein